MKQFNANARSNSRQKGFTIVELVVVIILLGILAATALPRFMDIDEEAHEAAFDGVMGGFTTGIALYHAQWIAEGQDAPGTQIDEFGNLRVNAEGYPYSTTANANNRPESETDCVDVFNNILQSGPSISGAATTAGLTGSTTDYTAVEAGNVCSYYYTGENNAAGQVVEVIQYTPATGRVIQAAPFTLI